MKTLHLVLKKQWYDMIDSGEKPEEYRDLSRYWFVRLCRKEFDAVKFTHGYARNARSMTFKLKDLTVGKGVYKWGALPGFRYFKIKLGERID